MENGKCVDLRLDILTDYAEISLKRSHLSVDTDKIEHAQ